MGVTVHTSSVGNREPRYVSHPEAGSKEKRAEPCRARDRSRPRPCAVTPILKAQGRTNTCSYMPRRVRVSVMLPFSAESSCKQSLAEYLALAAWRGPLFRRKLPVGLGERWAGVYPLAKFSIARDLAEIISYKPTSYATVRIIAKESI